MTTSRMHTVVQFHCKRGSTPSRGPPQVAAADWAAVTVVREPTATLGAPARGRAAHAAVEAPGGFGSSTAAMYILWRGAGRVGARAVIYSASSRARAGRRVDVGRRCSGLQLQP